MFYGFDEMKKLMLFDHMIRFFGSIFFFSFKYKKKTSGFLSSDSQVDFFFAKFTFPRNMSFKSG